ncbi:MAG: hypothetical protein KME30_01920 [Iphinoe sp. HA4291-MV1]|nr:hypothetical protein [Iphinoe sp. HA4291-MV1]
MGNGQGAMFDPQFLVPSSRLFCSQFSMPDAHCPIPNSQFPIPNSHLYQP